MLINYLKTAFRNLWRNKLYAVMNISGLGLAIACVIVAFLNYDYAARFDRFHKNAGNIYRVLGVRNINNRELLWGMTSLELNERIKADIPDVEQSICMERNTVRVKYQDQVFNETVLFADANFFDFFTFPLRQGVANLRDKNTIVLSEGHATKYFGQQDAIGKTLTVIHANGVSQQLTVTGIAAKHPPNSSIVFDMIASTRLLLDAGVNQANDWRFWTHALFVQVSDPGELEKIEEQLKTYLPLHNAVNLRVPLSGYRIFSLSRIAKEAHSIRNNVLRSPYPSSQTIGVAIIALMLLVMSCCNFINTSLAFSYRRFKEIGVRKVVGGMRRQLAAQFLSENMLLATLGLILAFILLIIFIPAFNSFFSNVKIAFNFWQEWRVIGFILAVLVITGFGAGLYPALVISAYKPISIFKERQKAGKIGLLMQTLLSIQFVLSIVTIIASVVFTQNAKFLQKFDVGYEKESIITIPIYNEQTYTLFRNAVQDYSNINGIAGCQSHVIYTGPRRGVRHLSEELEAFVYRVGFNYAETMRLRLRQGRNFEQKTVSDVQQAAMVNETFVKEMGLTEAVGKTISVENQSYQIVGVIEDVYSQGPWEPVMPSVLLACESNLYTSMQISVGSEKLAETMEYLKTTWAALLPDQPFEGFFQNFAVASAVQLNQGINRMFYSVAFITILIAALGLFALVSLSVANRTKEIGVRKVLGASTPHVTFMVLRRFVTLLVASMLLANVVSFFAIRTLLDSIWAYHIEVGMLTVLLGNVIVLAVAILTVASQVRKIAETNPVRSLRYE